MAKSLTGAVPSSCNHKTSHIPSDISNARDNHNNLVLLFYQTGVQNVMTFGIKSISRDSAMGLCTTFYGSKNGILQS